MIRIKQLREEKHLSQQQLADKLNVTQSSVSKYEIGLAEPDTNSIIIMSKLFGVSADYLLGISDSRIGIASSDLKEDETLILNDYRRLDGVGREKAQAYIKGLLGD